MDDLEHAADKSGSSLLDSLWGLQSDAASEQALFPITAVSPHA
jgi:hypothetical protein